MNFSISLVPRLMPAGGAESPSSTAQPLAPVIPSSGAPVPVPTAPEDVVCGIGRIDASGRIADRAVISALGWRGGDRLTLTADAGVVTTRRDPGDMVTLPGRAYIAVPDPSLLPAAGSLPG